MWRMRRLSSALLLFCLLAPSVAAKPPAGATPESGAGATPTSAAPQPAAVPPPNWGSCGRIVDDTSHIPSARCTTVPVPVDYNDPGGPQIQLAVIRIPATGKRIGALLINPGGPGASAVDSVAGLGAALAGSEISRRFDLVGFDPRGVGHSTPTIRCRTDAEFDAYRREPQVDYSPAGVAHIEQLNRQLAQGCVRRMGLGFLANVGTASAVRDMDVVRQALGEQQINYLGFSYGTELGTAYVEQFGDHVRAMVLDGAVDPAGRWARVARRGRQVRCGRRRHEASRGRRGPLSEQWSGSEPGLAGTRRSPRREAGHGGFGGADAPQEQAASTIGARGCSRRVDTRSRW